MKAAEVLRLLKINRATLSGYVKRGIIKVKDVLPSKQYEYDEESVYSILYDGKHPRKNYIYARVTTEKQLEDLEKQISIVKEYCIKKGIKVHGIYNDVASGLSFEHRYGFFHLLDKVFDKEVRLLVVYSEDRLARVGFHLIEKLLNNWGTKIEVIDYQTDIITDCKELLNELLVFFSKFNMKFYSNRQFIITVNKFIDKNGKLKKSNKNKRVNKKEV